MRREGPLSGMCTRWCSRDASRNSIIITLSAFFVRRTPSVPRCPRWPDERTHLHTSYLATCTLYAVPARRDHTLVTDVATERRLPRRAQSRCTERPPATTVAAQARVALARHAHLPRVSTRECFG